MTDKELMLGKILDKIADEITITPTMQEKAVKSYEAVGQWLGEGIDFDVRIMPQGSMNLGTVIKPIDDRDDYDMDLVCLLENGQSLPLREIKHLVGNRLKEHATYHRLLEEEGKRCWTMQYDEFHMDILPCVPKDISFIEPFHTDIKLTHKGEDGLYSPRFSNPYAYHKWFEERMQDILIVEKRAFAAKNHTEIEKVPTYRMRTPLQKAIQLLKRHRDMCFQNNADIAPISIIITTLAAQSYAGEKNVFEALNNIVAKMPEHIEYRSGVYWISNPVMQEENFADKWATEPEKRTAFMKWVAKAQSDLLTDPLGFLGIENISAHYQKWLGEAPVGRAIRAMGYETKAARESGNLYVNGLTGGLSTAATTNSRPVEEHTFFGK